MFPTCELITIFHDFPDFKAAAPVFLNPMGFLLGPRDPWSNHSNPPRDRRLPKPPMMPEHLPENPQEGAKSAGSVSPGAENSENSTQVQSATIFYLSAHIHHHHHHSISLPSELHLRESVCWGWLICCKYLWWYFYYYIYIHIHI